MIPEGSGQRPGHPPCSIPCEVRWPSRIYVRTALPRVSAHAVLALHLPDDQRASAAHRLADDQFKKGRSVVVAKAREAFRTAWPLAGVGFGVAVNALWI